MPLSSGKTEGADRGERKEEDEEGKGSVQPPKEGLFEGEEGEEMGGEDEVEADAVEKQGKYQLVSLRSKKRLKCHHLLFCAVG